MLEASELQEPWLVQVSYMAMSYLAFATALQPENVMGSQLAFMQAREVSPHHSTIQAYTPGGVVLG